MNIRYPIYEGVYRILTFKKDVTVFKKGEKEPVGDNERRNIDDEFK